MAQINLAGALVELADALIQFAAGCGRGLYSEASAPMFAETALKQCGLDSDPGARELAQRFLAAVCSPEVAYPSQRPASAQLALHEPSDQYEASSEKKDSEE